MPEKISIRSDSARKGLPESSQRIARNPAKDLWDCPQARKSITEENNSFCFKLGLRHSLQKNGNSYHQLTYFI